MTYKRSSTVAMQVGGFYGPIRNCDIEYVIVPGTSESFESPEEFPEIELLDVRLEGTSIMHTELGCLISEEELTRVVNELFEGYEHEI